MFWSSRFSILLLAFYVHANLQKEWQAGPQSRSFNPNLSLAILFLMTAIRKRHSLCIDYLGFNLTNRLRKTKKFAIINAYKFSFSKSGLNPAKPLVRRTPND